MIKSKCLLFSAIFLAGALPFVSSAYADDTQGTDVQTPPADVQQSPAGVPTPPTDVQQPPADAQTPPTDTQAPPTDGQAPADNGQAPSADAPAQTAPPTYEIKSFFLDSKKYQLGDTVPDLYRTKPYEIVQWQLRHLPAPDAGTHWTYIGGNYAMITDDTGKIMKAISGDIFFRG